MFEYYKRFLVAFWKDFSKSTREQVIGALLAVAILILQIHYGVIKDAEIKGNEWAVAWPYISLVAAIFIVHAIRVPFKLDQEHQRVRGELEAYRSNVENTRPRLMWGFPDPQFVENTAFIYGDIVMGTAKILKVKFINKPHTPSVAGVAKEVRAKILFFRDGNQIVEMKGRWSENPEPKPREPKLPLLPIDFGVDQEHYLDIAFREPNGGFVAWSNDNYDYGDFRKPEHRMTLDETIVKILLSGHGVREEFSFRFAGDGLDGIKIMPHL